MVNPKQIIIDNLEKWLKSKNIDAKFEVSLSQNPQFGDFTTNVVMQISKKLGKNPRELAEEIKSEIENWNLEFLEKVEVAGPGFINFYLSDKYLSDNLSLIDSEKDNYGHSNVLENVRTIVEFGDPNPFKQIHIGHLRNFCIGESFSRLLEAQGAGVTRVNYQGDVGMHVAKALYGILQDQRPKTKDQNLTAEDLANAYAYGATAYEENEEAKKEIERLNKLIYEEDKEIRDLWEKGRKISLDDFAKLYNRINVSYDKYYLESLAAKRGREIVLNNIENGIFERDEGAIIYRGEKEGLHTRVFLTSEDYATYEAKDLALAVMKDEDLHYDKSIILTGNEQTEYFQVMLAALKKISPELAGKTKHLTFGHVRLKDGKMSSRTGDVITAEWLLDEAVRKIEENFKEVDEETSERIGIGAVKYSMLKFSINSDIHFDFDESINLEGSSGPYIQYAYVRTQSVLQKTKDQRSKIKDQTQNLKLEKEEQELLRYLTYYPYYVEKAATEFAPNVICNYLFDLSQKFNLFYQKHKIIGSENESFRVGLTKATGQVIKNGLDLLGIETVERM
jgi:arginyl-tRNA synthetase